MAKNVFTKEQYPSRYAEMANSLGLAYTDLAHANTDSIEYLASALSSFIDAIDIYEQSYDMDNYGSALVNAALTCIDIFDGVGDEEYVVQAIDLLKQAKGILFDERGEEYTKALYNLAIASMKFSRLHSDSSYVVEAINNLKELMSLSGSSKDMHLFAAASYEAGRAYHYLYSLQEEKGLLEEAIDMYTTSMNYSEDGTPSQELAATYLYLGDAKTELGIVSNEASHIKESLDYFDGAIRCYGTQVPSALGTATLHKAMAEQSLYDINADENHLINAVKLYESALIIFKDVTDAIAEISSLLAEVYMLLYDTACDVGHLKRAHELYVDALDYFSKDNASERHEFIKGRLEDIRKKLEEV